MGLPALIAAQEESFDFGELGEGEGVEHEDGEEFGAEYAGLAGDDGGGVGGWAGECEFC